MEEAKAIQDKLDELQQEMHAKVEACDVKFNTAKNAVFAARRETIADLIAKKQVPANFWALALIRLLQLKDRESTTMPHFLGPYDEELLKTYLEEIRVEYNEKGHKITLHFKPNPFFEETQLWAEAVEVMDAEDEDEEDLPPVEESWSFSGVTWKEGHGPRIADEDDEDDEEGDSEDDAPGKKRTHAAAAPAAGASTASSADAMHGPSVLEVFTEMPPHPEEDEELDEEDDDVMADAIEDWEAEMDDRKMLLRLIELYIHHNPVEAIQEAAAAAEANGADGETAAKKAKTE
ncbi:hypothetical protein ABB37_08552 [Leptomonas pyrrhocoris]|uniref:Nucleosome assembly protein n=1 Tax=Leptomonas pyrrhocoris TaxID=157538 RepID=A0A0M9FSN5_LEPPY|nr:hypothetical protein ABB37_08552 [Leptomonas pyrrhocoris]KPA75245.1 hypothetical protein ABB37_08552 [Leptomonas pyrrhocoris]|eukprot:XP_015653684.1 hypothetical protein ABB37_08552 [Leptomonas pyrrhocoris]